MIKSNISSSSVDKKEYVVNHSFNCNDKCIIVYLFTCNKCKMQYVGNAVDDFHLRWNNYKDNDRKYLRKESCINNTYLSTSQARVTIVFWMTSPLSWLIKLIPKDHNKQEHYWRRTLKAMAPQGLNVEDDWFLQFWFTYISHTIYSYNYLD